jgi:hypothetical protein
MESFQKRDRDRKKMGKRLVKEARRKERADRRRDGPAATLAPPAAAAAPTADSRRVPTLDAGTSS